MKSKSTLRQLMRARKNAFTQQEREQQSHEIMRLLEDLPVFQKAHVVLLYASLPDEVQTMEFISKWQGRKQILLPVVVGDELEVREYALGTSLEVGSYGIPEPRLGRIVTDYSVIDLAIIPGVAFTMDGKRLGRGKGYYDRLLSHPTFGSVYKLGICYPFQLLSELPTSSHDVSLDEILTLHSANPTY